MAVDQVEGAVREGQVLRVDGGEADPVGPGREVELGLDGPGGVRRQVRVDEAAGQVLEEGELLAGGAVADQEDGPAGEVAGDLPQQPVLGRVVPVPEFAERGDRRLGPLAGDARVFIVVEGPLLGLGGPVEQLEYALVVDEARAAARAGRDRRVHGVAGPALEAAEADLVGGWHGRGG